ncbi:MAG: MBG domain-containing protein, partial [Verrucomicrobia bacterium]|nr:MBG domain-containing protein [Verrucomicrobiota bacterium]
SHTLTFTAIGGATAYKWNRWNFTDVAAENCENISNITTSTTGTYAVLNTTIKQQGTASYHLENTISPGASQSIQLSPLYYGQSTPALSFQSRVRYATSYEQCKVQVKVEGSAEWLDVYSQTGTDSDAEASFTLRSAALTAMAGKAFRVRFLLSYAAGGSYYAGYSGDLVGWFIDAITFTGVSTLGNNECQSLSGTNGSFTPGAGTYLMSVTPVISERDYPASYQALSVSGTTAATVTLGSLAASYNGSPKCATATTSPPGLTVNFTYNESPTAPTNVGSYAVVGTISDTNYQGSASGTLVISVLPVILSQPVSPTITKNTSTTLTVIASGTALTYQWYAGTAGNTSNPIATGASYT